MTIGLAFLFACSGPTPAVLDLAVEALGGGPPGSGIGLILLDIVVLPCFGDGLAGKGAARGLAEAEGRPSPGS